MKKDNMSCLVIIIILVVAIIYLWQSDILNKSQFVLGMKFSSSTSKYEQMYRDICGEAGNVDGGAVGKIVPFNITKEGAIDTVDPYLLSFLEKKQIAGNPGEVGTVVFKKIIISAEGQYVIVGEGGRNQLCIRDVLDIYFLNPHDKTCSKTRLTGAGECKDFISGTGNFHIPVAEEDIRALFAQTGQ